MRLYKKGKSSVLVWEITQHGDTLKIKHGILDGRMQTEYVEIEEGKQNRTIEEQAEFRMERRIEMKLRAGYCPDVNNLSDASVNQLGFKKPMLAHSSKYEKIDYSCAYIQRKYNGHRCLITMKNGECMAYGRGGKQITSISHILNGLSDSMRDGVTLDGELYIHGHSLQSISSKVMTQGVTAHDLNFICYDMMGDEPFYDRYLKANLYCRDSINFHIADTASVFNFKEIEDRFRKFKNEGYEGAIIRHGKQGYLCGKRSIGTMKVKKIGSEGYEDEEFKVIEILESKTGWAILVCITKEGNKFRVSAPGTHRQKREVLYQQSSYLGRNIKVEFPEWTENKIPSQPIAIMWREIENE